LDSGKELADEFVQRIGKVFVGKREIIEILLTAFLAGLPALIEDVPGVGKTTLAKCLAAVTGLDFGRIQFTPDLLPGDILGMTIWSQEKRDFIFKPGAIMHQFLLADEINRASARTQSALLEAMQENHITVDGNTYHLPEPFFVIATQNPSSFSGTFLLPEAQIDRFGVSFSIGYPQVNDEIAILEQHDGIDPLQPQSEKLSVILSSDEITRTRLVIAGLHTDIKIKRYIVEIAESTRTSDLLKMGISPRASIHLLQAARAGAYIAGRDYVLPEDVRHTAPWVLSHRITPSPNAQMERRTSRDIIEEILGSVSMPTGVK
jgi:MoxR-like ATPase